MSTILGSSQGQPSNAMDGTRTPQLSIDRQERPLHMAVNLQAKQVSEMQVWHKSVEY